MSGAFRFVLWIVRFFILKQVYLETFPEHMTDFTQMHVFFAVTTAAVILVTALICAVLVAFFRFFNTLNRIANEVQEEAMEIRADLDEMREGMKEGFRFVPLFNFFGKSAKRATRKKPARRKAS